MKDYSISHYVSPKTATYMNELLINNILLSYAGFTFKKIKVWLITNTQFGDVYYMAPQMAAIRACDSWQRNGMLNKPIKLSVPPLFSALG